MAGYRISEIRRSRGWSQQRLAEALGTTQQQIARYESGARDPRADVVVRIADALGSTVSELLGFDSGEVEPAAAAPSRQVPLVGRIAAGTPREAIAQADRSHETLTSLADAHPEAYWLRVSGNSMNKLFPDGTLVLIDPNERVRNGDVGVVFVDGEDATLKRVYFDDGRITLHPESYDPDYRDRTICADDPGAPEVRIAGKAITYTAPDGWRA